MKPRPQATVSSSGAPVLVIALGGNAITRADDDLSVGAQFARTKETAELLVPVIASGRYRVLITHGNGPQVGNILLRSDITAEAGLLPRLPIDSAVADTQGAMGYMIQQCLANALWESGIRMPVVTLVTQVIVDESDPAFADPSKPIGRFYRDEETHELIEVHGWTMKRDSAGKGWRRVVPSPEPVEIVELDIIRELLDERVIVIAAGGGGVPVIAGEGGALHGTEAVIDKDLASSLLATGLGAPIFAVGTDVERVSIDFKLPTQRDLDRVDIATLRRYQTEGHFPPGSMGPKIEAAIRFLENGGETAIITSPEALEKALDGRAGTHVSPTLPAGAAVRETG
ncbi:MAG TPA: carbamate kinase [Actinomycetota bacterium]|jgi:carbamate kinase|nr:carbamate kinase [Actinomycetota bacterium]